MILINVDKNQSVIVKKVLGGRKMLSRLNSMGIVSNSIITILRNTPEGPLLIKLADSVLSIGRGICSKIIVEYETSNK